MNSLSDRQIAVILQPYGIAADLGLFEQIRTYVSILLKWNSTISLTTVIDPVEIYRFHFGESIFGSSAVGIHEGRLADVGSGAGFPGLPLRMVCPAIELTLIESNTRKAGFLSEVVRSLGLDGVGVFRGRMEDHRPDKPYDWITARALGQHDGLLRWSKKNLAASGRAVLWLGEGEANRVSQTPGWEWRLPIPIPGSKRRLLLAGSPKTRHPLLFHVEHS
jgi:16S rRNA (guanine527-N7)-methyltransferase